MAAEVFLETVISKRSEATQIQYRDFLERLVYPKLGKIKVADIKHSDISGLHYRFEAHACYRQPGGSGAFQLLFLVRASWSSAEAVKPGPWN